MDLEFRDKRSWLCLLFEKQNGYDLISEQTFKEVNIYF